MPILQLDIQAVSPLFMAGADQREPEVRAASFRGAFRYWTRAVLGARYQRDYDALKKRESHYWGSTQRGSGLRVVVNRHTRRDRDDRYVILPPTFRNDKANRLPAFPVESGVRLSVETPFAHRATSLFTDELYASLLLAFWLSGFGKRARRGGGSLQVVEIATDVSADPLVHLQYIPRDADDIARHLAENVFPYVREVTSGYDQAERPFHNVPDYTVMLPGMVTSYVGLNTYNDYADALQRLWDLTGPYHHDRNSPWGRVRGGRRASIVHMRVIRSESGYHQMATILRAGSEREDWSRMDDLHNTLDGANDFVTIPF